MMRLKQLAEWKSLPIHRRVARMKADADLTGRRMRPRLIAVDEFALMTEDMYEGLRRQVSKDRPMAKAFAVSRAHACIKWATGR